MNMVMQNKAQRPPMTEPELAWADVCPLEDI